MLCCCCCCRWHCCSPYKSRCCCCYCCRLAPPPQCQTMCFLISPGCHLARTPTNTLRLRCAAATTHEQLHVCTRTHKHTQALLLRRACLQHKHFWHAGRIQPILSPGHCYCCCCCNQQVHYNNPNYIQREKDPGALAELAGRQGVATIDASHY
jgi:hypothetical protein